MRQFRLETSSNEIHTFLGRLETVRCAVLLLIPVSSVISRHEWPCERKWAIFEVLTIFF
jgi:hypothetical protein